MEEGKVRNGKVARVGTEQEWKRSAPTITGLAVGAGEASTPGSRGSSRPSPPRREAAEELQAASNCINLTKGGSCPSVLTVFRLRVSQKQ